MKLLFVAALAAIIVGDQAAAVAAQAVRSAGDLPQAVADVYEKACAADNWISGKRDLSGSSTSTFADGTRAYLLVCGDAASVIPFTAIVLSTSGDAHEAKLNWQWHGKSLDDAGLSNAHFAANGAILSRAHESARCEPTYMHVWDGGVFQLRRINRHGCDRGK